MFSNKSVFKKQTTVVDLKFETGASKQSLEGHSMAMSDIDLKYCWIIDHSSFEMNNELIDAQIKKIIECKQTLINYIYLYKKTVVKTIIII